MAAAVFTASGVARHLDRIALETGHHPAALREQFHSTLLPVRTALASARATFSSYGAFLLATGVMHPDDYGLTTDSVHRIIRKMSVDDLATITIASVRGFVRVIMEDAGIKEDHYR
jgi:hypothetical protein